MPRAIGGDGNAATQITARMANGANGAMEVEPTMDVQNVGEALAFRASLSLDANVTDIIVMTTKIPLRT
jgi:hypothetical protein